MSKNKGYNNFYKKPKQEEPVNEAPVEEVQTTEEIKAEAPVEEKVEEVQTQPKEPIKQYAVVSGAKRVNMRKDPSKDAKVLTILEEGTRVEILKNPDRTWAKIMYKDLIGYMMYMYIRPED